MKIKYGKLRIKDFPEVYEWNKNYLFCKLTNWKTNLTIKDVEQFWRDRIKTIKSDDNFESIGIYVDDKLIGYLDFYRVEEKTLEIGICIGVSSFLRKGIATDAMKYFMNKKVHENGINKFIALVDTKNNRSIKLMKKLGFVLEDNDSSSDTYLFKYEVKAQND